MRQVSVKHVFQTRGRQIPLLLCIIKHFQWLLTLKNNDLLKILLSRTFYPACNLQVYFVHVKSRISSFQIFRKRATLWYELHTLFFFCRGPLWKRRVCEVRTSMPRFLWACANDRVLGADQKKAGSEDDNCLLRKLTFDAELLGSVNGNRIFCQG